MNAYPIKKVLITLGIALLLAGCGDTPPDEPQASERKPSAIPKLLPDTLKVKRSSKTYVITGIGLGGSNKVAIINNKVIKRGMEIDPGVVLKDVQSTYATIRFGNTDYLIRPENIQSELDKKKR